MARASASHHTPSVGGRRKFGTEKLDVARISCIILRDVELGERSAGEIGSSQQGGLPTELNVTAPGCLRGPLSRYAPLPLSLSSLPPPPSLVPSRPSIAVEQRRTPAPLARADRPRR